MISRVAENSFWLHRYVERVESTARVLSVNRLAILDAEIHEAQRWKPLILAVGEQERFEKLIGVTGYDKDIVAEEYLTWSTDNPVSIVSSFAGARENARMSREVISREMWETLNITWQWLQSPAARKEYRKDRVQFYESVRSACSRFQGDCHNTMLHDEPFDFMRLGMLLERASQTVRVMNVKSHWLVRGPRPDAEWETPLEAAQWMGLLRLCAAVEPFFKRHSAAPTGPLVASFLLQDVGFPRSVLHCFDRARNFIERIDGRTKRRGVTKSFKQAMTAAGNLRKANVAKFTQAELQAELIGLGVTTGELCDQLYVDYFDPTP